MTDRRRGGRSPLGPSDGSATLLVVLWMAVLAVAASGGLVVQACWAARQRAADAADLAALAGATAALEGPGPACRRAASVARENGGRVVSCDVRGVGVRLVVLGEVPHWLDGRSWVSPTWFTVSAAAELVAGDQGASSS